MTCSRVNFTYQGLTDYVRAYYKVLAHHPGAGTEEGHGKRRSEWSVTTTDIRTGYNLKASALLHTLDTNKRDRCYRRRGLCDDSIETSNFLCTYFLHNDASGSNYKVINK